MGSASRRVAARCVIGGLLVTASLPPFGWWPLTFPGIALLDSLIAEQPALRRFRRGWLWAMAWLLPSTLWMWWLTKPGWILQAIVYSGYIGLACALTPPGRWRRVALPAAITLAELIRFAWPFGGVPLASFAIAQANGPLLGLARIAGALGLIAITVIAGQALASLARGTLRPAFGGVAVVVGLAAVAYWAPSGHPIGTLRVALVQGGGPQGTHAIDTDEQLVFERHLEASQSVRTPVDLVMWPENVVHVDGPLAGTPENAQLSAEARRLGATLIVGVIEDIGTDRFRNAAVAYSPTGDVIARYEKVRRVPFGEYLPLRSLFSSLPGVPTDLIPRDAIPGKGPAILQTPAGDFGVVVSWEVFFGGRARDAIGHGGTVLLNPTNGASYHGTMLQTQQVASSRLRAIETGRTVLQAAPTGFTAVITAGGHVLHRTSISERAIVQDTIVLRDGKTWYLQLGDVPLFFVAIGVIAGVWALLGPSTRPRARGGHGNRTTRDGEPWTRRLPIFAGRFSLDRLDTPDALPASPGESPDAAPTELPERRTPL